MREFLQHYNDLYIELVVQKQEIDSAKPEHINKLFEYQNIMDLIQARMKELPERLEREIPNYAEYEGEDKRIRACADVIGENYNRLFNECQPGLQN